WPASAACCSWPAASTATSSEPFHRYRSRTKIWRKASTSWRSRLSTQVRALPSSAADTAPAVDVSLVSLRKTFGDVVAVDRIDLEIARGEFFTMLGPSGSGKTTTLRLIAGFEKPDAGRILLGGGDVAGRPPY